MKKFIIASDIHGDQQDHRATAACLDFIKDFKPDIRVIAGDLWDFAAIRRGASDEDRALSMRDDFEAGVGFAERFYSAGSENHLLYGNHDVRPYDLLGSPDAVRRDLGERMVADITAMAKRLKAKTYPYDSRKGVMAIGHLNIVHGFHTGISAAPQHSRIYGNVVYGHAHSIDCYQTPGLHQKEARCIGCLCNLDMEYAARNTGKLRWAHGWAYGWVNNDGTYNINQVRGVNGKFVAATAIKEY